MSKNMSVAETTWLLQYIYDYHSPFVPPKGIVVKYVTPHIDMRNGACFSIEIQKFGGAEVCFYTGNEHMDNPKSLRERVIHWLHTGEIT